MKAFHKNANSCVGLKIEEFQMDRLRCKKCLISSSTNLVELSLVLRRMLPKQLEFSMTKLPAKPFRGSWVFNLPYHSASMLSATTYPFLKTLLKPADQ